MDKFRLHYFPESGNSYKLALMLRLCGKPFELVWVDFLGGETRKPSWREAVNEMGEVPVLEHGTSRLTQTAPILLRLSERFGQFGAASKEQHYELLRWLFWDNHKLTSYLATYRFMRAFTRNPDPSVLNFMRSRVNAALAIAERRLERHNFVLGVGMSIADISMCAYLSYPAEETGYELPQSHPATWAWLQRIANAPRWLPPYELLPGQRFRNPV
jgi:glutathione S-transferase